VLPEDRLDNRWHLAALKTPDIGSAGTPQVTEKLANKEDNHETQSIRQHTANHRLQVELCLNLLDERYQA